MISQWLEVHLTTEGDAVREGHRLVSGGDQVETEEGHVDLGMIRNDLLTQKRIDSQEKAK